MIESFEKKRPLLYATIGRFHDRVVYPIAQGGYNHMQRQIGEGIRERGLTLSQSIDAVYTRMGAGLQLFPENTSTVDALSNGAGIFVGNNPFGGASFQYLRALRERPTDDVYLVEKGITVPYWDARAHKYLLPVYSKLPGDNATGYLAEAVRRAPEYQRIQELTQDEKRQLNSQTLYEAATKVTNGGIVTIFPSGGGDEYALWRRGIGDLVMQLGERRPDARFIMGYTTGTSQWDRYKLAPGVNKIKPVSVNIYVSALNLHDVLSTLPANSDSKTIAQHLSDTYMSWVYLRQVAMSWATHKKVKS